jgi:UDP-N-acetylglucosamine 4-epimerase
VCQINLLAATVSDFPLLLKEEGMGEVSLVNQVYNVAIGDRATLNQLYEQLYLNLLPRYSHLRDIKALYRDFRAGDVRHSLADINKANILLGYEPTHRIGEGLKVAMGWYVRSLAQQGKI